MGALNADVRSVIGMADPQQPADNTDWFAANAPSPNTGVTGTATPTGAGTPAVSGTGLQGDAAYDAFGKGWLASGGRTVADLKAYADQWNSQNPNAKVTLGGSKGDKVYGPNGEYWQDAVIGAGAGGQGANWGPKGGGGGAGGQIPLGDFGSLAQGWQGSFTAPTVDQIRQMPGYQFALNEGVKALDTSAAAKGTVLSGGQQKDILQYATGLLDQTAQQKYQNALGEYMNAYNIFRNNQNDVFNRFDTLAGRGTSAANAATS